MATKEIAFIPLPAPTTTSRSHFETQDTIELGQPVGGAQLPVGLMSRTARSCRAKPISFTTQLPFDLPRRRGGANIALNFAGKPAVGERNAALIQACTRARIWRPP